MRYVALVSVWIFVYVASFFMLPPDAGLYYYSYQSAWSLLLILSIYILFYREYAFPFYVISGEKVIKLLLSLETFLIFLNLLACLEYRTQYRYVYDSYVFILNTVNAIELILLIAGGRWDAIIDRIAFYRTRTIDFFQTYIRRLDDL